MQEQKKHVGIYALNTLTRKVCLEIREIGGEKEILNNLKKKLQLEIEGKCINGGFVKQNSVNVLTYSSGVLTSNRVEFTVVFECLMCNPVEGMKIFKCLVTNITKAGIKATLPTTEEGEYSPVTIFLARDHHIDNTYFATVKENDVIAVRVIGIRYQLNDVNVAVIAEILQPKVKKPTFTIIDEEKKKKKLKLVIAQ